MAIERVENAQGILDPEEFARHVTLRRFVPSDDLADFVEFYWVVAWDLPAGKKFISENLPYPSVHIVFEPDGSYVQGVMTGRFAHTATGKAEVFSVKFLPGMAFPFIGRPLSSFTDERIDVNDAFGGSGLSLARAVHCAVDADARIAVVNAFLRDRLSATARPTPQTCIESCTGAHTIVDWIASHREATMVRYVERKFGKSARSLQALFSKYVGVGPKWVIRRYRMLEAVESLHANLPPDLVTLALDLGYTDQAHFTNDFRNMTGRTPGEYSKVNRELHVRSHVGIDTDTSPP